jgi:hypothetical protein
MAGNRIMKNTLSIITLIGCGNSNPLSDEPSHNLAHRPFLFLASELQGKDSD